MSDLDFKLFDSDGTDLVLPGQNDINLNKELMSQGTEEAISGEYVKEVLIPDEYSINTPNFLIDLGEVSEMTPNQMSALSSLLTSKLEDADTFIYLKTHRGIYQLGMAIKNKVDSLIGLVVQRAIGDEIKVYRDITENNPGELVKLNDITKIRLNI
jgi:hypothetical protein